MATTSISITPQFGNNSVIAIDCGASSPRLGGTIDISAFPNLQRFRCVANNITAISGYASNSNITDINFFNNRVPGTLPSLSGMANLKNFICSLNLLSGSLPSLSALTNLQDFFCRSNSFTGQIPILSGLSNLQIFVCHDNTLTGSIPSLSGLEVLRQFYCYENQLTGFGGGSVSNTLGDFQAQINQLNQSSIDTILSAFDATTRTTGTMNLFLQAGTNAAPSYTGGVTTVSAGNLFTTLGTVVTAQCTNHGHPDNSLVTLSGNGGFQSVFTGTFQISAINANQFRYTVSTNSPTLVTGTGQVAMRRTTNATDGFRYYQNLALVSRYGTPSPVLQGFPWSVNINFP